MQNINLSEENGLFYLSYTPEFIPNDDLGRGSNEITIRFTSCGERATYVSLTQRIEKLDALLEQSLSEIRYLKTTKGANANLRNVRKLKKYV